jgi:hypothetical protein
MQMISSDYDEFNSIISPIVTVVRIFLGIICFCNALHTLFFIGLFISSSVFSSSLISSSSASFLNRFFSV